MLIGSLQVEIRRIGELVAGIQYSGMGNPRVEPDIQSIRNLGIVCSFVTQQLCSIEIKPGINARLLNTLGNHLNQLGSARVPIAGFPVNKQGYRHTPGALT